MRGQFWRYAGDPCTEWFLADPDNEIRPMAEMDGAVAGFGALIAKHFGKTALTSVIRVISMPPAAETVEN